MITTITIGGTTYNATGMIAKYFLGLNELTISIDGYWSLNWTICGYGPMPTFKNGMPVTVSDGTLRFTGMLDHYDPHQGDHGWEHRIACVDLRQMLDRVTVRGSDGSGNAVYNRPPTDGPLYQSALAGLTVGQMIALLLTIPANANDLAAYGMLYTSLAPPTLPAQTTTDLGALFVVPTHMIVFSGPSMIDACDQLVRYWMPRFTVWVQPDGTFRVTNLFSMPANSLVVGGETGTTFDPVFGLEFTRDSADCYTQIKATGVNITSATLSEQAGTLVRGWDPSLDATWTLLDFQQPANAYDYGAINVGSETNANCVVTSHSTATDWVTNYWPPLQGWIQLINFAANGIEFSDTRQITSNTAMVAGGTSTINWDATNPLTSILYANYVIRGNAGGESDVGRLWFVCEPNGHLIGLNTWIGSHMVPQGPIPLPFSNNSVVFNTTTPVFFVQYSTSGTAPFIEVPLTAQIITQGTDGGGFRLTAPIWQATTTNAQLLMGEPATPATGAYYDIIAMVFYNRENLVAYAPGPTAGYYSGTAYTVDGIQRYRPIPIADWTYTGLTSNVQLYINELLLVHQDAVIQGEISHYGVPAHFDPLTLGYSLRITFAGQPGPLDTVNLPVRSVTLRWLPGGGPTNHLFTFHFSNLRRPFQGESLYIHPLDYGAGKVTGSEQLPFDANYTNSQGQLGHNAFNTPGILGPGATVPTLPTPGAVAGGFGGMPAPMGGGNAGADSGQPAPRKRIHPQIHHEKPKQIQHTPERAHRDLSQIHHRKPEIKPHQNALRNDRPVPETSLGQAAKPTPGDNPTRTGGAFAPQGNLGGAPESKGAFGGGAPGESRGRGAFAGRRERSKAHGAFAGDGNQAIPKSSGAFGGEHLTQNERHNADNQAKEQRAEKETAAKQPIDPDRDASDDAASIRDQKARASGTGAGAE